MIRPSNAPRWSPSTITESTWTSPTATANQASAPSAPITTVTFDALAGADTVIDIAAGTVRSATLNGRELDVSGYDESTGIALSGLAEHNVVVVDADCRYSNTGEGLHRFVDPVDGEVYLYSQFETADAKRMFACFDQPDLKATFDVKVTAPQHWQVVSNGATVSVDGGVHTFATTPRMSTYLVALIAGPYARWDDVYRDEHGEIALGIFCRATLAEFMDAERLFTQTKQGFGFYHKNFGVPYAFGKYDQLFVPGVQRGRDGERRRGDVPGGLRLSQQGHPGVL